MRVHKMRKLRPDSMQVLSSKDDEVEPELDASSKFLSAACALLSHSDFIVCTLLSHATLKSESLKSRFLIFVFATCALLSYGGATCNIEIGNQKL